MSKNDMGNDKKATTNSIELSPANIATECNLRNGGRTPFSAFNLSSGDTFYSCLLLEWREKIEKQRLLSERERGRDKSMPLSN